MKNYSILRRSLMMMLMAFVVAVAGRAIAYAEDQSITVGPDSGEDFTEALKSALNTDHDGTLTVNVEPGTYTLTENVYIYSNTVLNAEGCTFNFAKGVGGTMLKGAHKHNGERCRADEGEGSCATGGYEQIQNVTVNGGTWNASGAGSKVSTQCIMFRHAENITIDGVTAKGNTNHAFNISGVNNASITNCTFTSPTKYDGDDKDFWGDIAEGDDTRFNSMEAVHLDFTCKTGEPKGKPLDNTPCKNITVSNCTFNGVFSGVGTHHVNGDSKKRADNISVKNCTFTNLRTKDKVDCYGRALTFYTADKVEFTNNTINGVYNAILMQDVSNVQAYDNTSVKNIKGNAFYVRKGCKGVIKNNIITSPTQTGVYVDASAVTVYNNTITGAKTHGIFVVNGSASTKINCNKISNTTKTGVYLNNGSTRVYKNTISGTKEQGVFANKAKSTIDENIISNSTKEGIYVFKSGNVTLKKNKINNAKTNGIGVMDSKTVKVHYNTVSAAGNNGMNILASASKATVTADIRNNTVKNSQKGLGILLQDGTNCVLYKNTVSGNAKNGIQVQGQKKKCIGTTVAYNTATGNRGAKDILINTKCNKTKVQFNTIPKSGRLYCFGDGSVLNKGNHYTNAVSIKSAKITGISNKRYNGTAQGQANLKVVMNGKTLKIGTHYKLTFENNVKKGTARVHIIGQGNYKDFVTKTFKIN